MANVFVDLPATSGDGTGAAQDTSTLGRIKTVTVNGSFPGTVTVEFSLDGGATWGQAMSFTAKGKKKIEIAADQMRVLRAGTTGKPPGTPNIDVAADNIGAQFRSLPSPSADGAAASVNTTALGTYNTVLVLGSFTGTVNIEISEDDVDYVDCMTFTQPGAKSKEFVARFMRVRRSGTNPAVPGLPVVNVGAINDATANGASGAFIGPVKMLVAGRQSYSPLDLNGPSELLAVGAMTIDPSDYPAGTTGFEFCVLAAKGAQRTADVLLFDVTDQANPALVGAFQFIDRDTEYKCGTLVIGSSPGTRIYEVRLQTQSLAAPPNGDSVELFKAEIVVTPLVVDPTPAGGGTGPAGTCLFPRAIQLNPTDQSVSAASGQPGNSVTLTNPVAAGADRLAQVGNVLFAHISVAHTVAGIATVTAPAGWVLIDAATAAGGVNNFDLHSYYKIASAAEPDDYTFTWDLAHNDLGGVATLANYEGIDTSGPSPVCAGAEIQTVPKPEVGTHFTVGTDVPFGGARMHHAAVQDRPDAGEVDNNFPLSGPFYFTEVARDDGGPEDVSMTYSDGSTVAVGRSTVAYESDGGASTEPLLIHYYATCPICCVTPGATPTVAATASNATTAGSGTSVSLTTPVPAGTEIGDVLIWAITHRLAGAGNSGAIANSVPGTLFELGDTFLDLPGVSDLGRIAIYVEAIVAGTSLVDRVFTGSDGIWAVSCLRIAGANQVGSTTRPYFGSVANGVPPALANFLPASGSGQFLPSFQNQETGLEPLTIHGPIPLQGSPVGNTTIVGQSPTQQLPIPSDNSLLVYVAWAPDPVTSGSLQTPPTGMTFEVGADGDIAGADFSHVALFSEAVDLGPASAKSQVLVSTAPTQDVTGVAMVMCLSPVCLD